jgi:long-chain acyl-CoA synthetase
MPDTDRSQAQLESEIRSYRRENLSPYKVPKEIRFVDAIPLTSVGKIDKKALRA